MLAPDAQRPSFGRRLRQAATERLALKGAALFFSCVLWLVVSAEEPTEQVVQIVVAPRLDSSLVLVGRRPVVRALVVGRARELLELAGDPPIARPLVSIGARSLAQTGDSVRVAVVPGDVEVPTNVQVIVREVRPRTVTIQVARVARPLPPATAAESALAGLVQPRVKADTEQAVLDTVALDTLPAVTPAMPAVPVVPAVRDTLRPDSVRPRRDTARTRRDSLRPRRDTTRRP